MSHHMNTNFRMLTAALAAVTLFAAAAHAQTTPKYNVLFIISDDMKNEPAAFGGRAIPPNIDALGKAGITFQRAYCQYPLCNPSRSSLLTGRYPGETGVL